MTSPDKQEFGERPDKVSGTTRSEKADLERRLQEASVRVARSASVEEGLKVSHEKGHSDISNQRTPTSIRGNYTIHGGGGLVLLDLDILKEELPDWVRELPSTFVVKTPHGGYHLYYAIEDDTSINNTYTNWGSIRYEGKYVVGPGSTIDHAQCDDGKANCPGEGAGRYDNIVNKPIATLSGDDLRHLRKTCNSSANYEPSGEEYGGNKITLPDETLADEGEQYICTDFSIHATNLASSDLMDLLRGGTGSYELRRNNNPDKIDQSAADYYALDMLYGAFLFRGEDEEDARRLTLAVFKRYCRENPFDKTGTPRKWLRKGERYLHEQMNAVQRQFDTAPWHRWRRRKYVGGFDAEEHKPWADPDTNGRPSITELDIVQASIWLLSTPISPERVADMYGLDLSSIPPALCGEITTPHGSGSSGDFVEYVTASEIAEFALHLNPDRERSYHEWVLKVWLQSKFGEVSMAFCPERPNGERYVYYPSDFPDPKDARWVRCGGKERELEAHEQEIMTDGGSPVENASMTASREERDVFNRIERARNPQSKNEEPEFLHCPICGQPMLDRGALRNHVANSQDDDHLYERLNSDLEVETEWHKVDWSPGPPAT